MKRYFLWLVWFLIYKTLQDYAVMAPRPAVLVLLVSKKCFCDSSAQLFVC